MTVSVVTVIRADEPLAGETAGNAWLDRLGEQEFTDELLDDTLFTLDRVRAADAAASGLPFGTPTTIGQILAARVGYGDGDQVASGRFIEAFDIDARGGTGGVKRERLARTRPTARTAAILGRREHASACELLIPRIRLDLNTGNPAAAALAIGPAVEATVAELEFAVEDEGHEADLDQLEGLLPELTRISGLAASGNLDPADLPSIEQGLAIAERVIRRRRILDQ